MLKQPERIASYIGLFSIGAVALSTIHEYFYYKIVGFQFFSTLTASDILRLAAEWLPIMSVSVAIGATIGARAASENEIAANIAIEKSDPIIGKAVLRYDRNMKIFYWSFMVISILSFLGDPENFVWLTLLIYSLAFCLFKIVHKLGFIDIDLLDKNRYFWTFILTNLVISSALYGLKDGYYSLRSDKYQYIVSSTYYNSEEINLLRTSDKGVLVRDRRDNTSFIPWDDVKRVAIIYHPGDKKNYANDLVNSIGSRFKNFR